MTFSDNIICRHKDQYITADLCIECRCWKATPRRKHSVEHSWRLYDFRLPEFSGKTFSHMFSIDCSLMSPFKLSRQELLLSKVNLADREMSLTSAVASYYIRADWTIIVTWNSTKDCNGNAPHRRFIIMTDESAQNCPFSRSTTNRDEDAWWRRRGTIDDTWKENLRHLESLRRVSRCRPNCYTAALTRPCTRITAEMTRKNLTSQTKK
jgi:hypothetical protein